MAEKHEADLRRALSLSGNSIAETARILGVTRKTVYAWMRRYGIVITKTPVKVVDEH
jgi:transcriptional regulator of acetoin/glycerol metabolism